MTGYSCLYDGSDSALYQRKVGPRVYHFIEVMDMHEVCPDGAGGARYAATLTAVDLDDLPADKVVRALNNAGLDTPGACGDGGLAEACWQYGCRAPLYQTASNSQDACFRAARKESYRLTRDPAALKAASLRIVNRNGSTAREYARGDLSSCDVRCRLRLRAADDPIAFMAGFMCGAVGRPRDVAPDGDTLADAYLAGYEWGSKVFAGEWPPPPFVQRGEMPG